MNITTEQADSVTILKLAGELDASCYKQVIAVAEQSYRGGARDLLLDMSELNFMSSSGLVALHRIALIFRGEGEDESQEGWSALHAASEFVESTPEYEKHFKLLNPQARVQQTLMKTGFNNLLEIFTDRSTALASFK